MNDVKELKAKVESRTERNVEFRIRNQILYYKGRYVLSNKSDLIMQIMKECHDSHLGEHPGIKRTIKRISLLFWWKGLAKQVKDYVNSCLVCQRMKTQTKKPVGLLMPLPTPKAVWRNISTDFITNLPCVKGKSVIIVVVDRLSKFCHLGALPAKLT